MASGIAETTHFYIRCGVSNQRLKALAAETDMSVVAKWQKMMEIFLQVRPLGSFGFPDALFLDRELNALQVLY